MGPLTTGLHWPLVSTGQWSPVEQLRGSRGHTWVMCDINLPPGSQDQCQLYIRLSQLTINLALVHFSTPLQYSWIGDLDTQICGWQKLQTKCLNVWALSRLFMLLPPREQLEAQWYYCDYEQTASCFHIFWEISAEQCVCSGHSSPRPR